jgi:AcrR family transcriptional regulator
VAQGYHAAAMDEIAERAGLSKPVLYQHFSGKLDLYLALLDDACTALVAAVRDALRSGSRGRDKAYATAAAYFRFTDDDAGAFRLVFESDLTTEPEVRRRLASLTETCIDEISTLIHEDAGLGVEESRLLAAGLVGLQQHAARYWLTQGRTVPLEEAAQLVSVLGWRGLRSLPGRGQDGLSAASEQGEESGSRRTEPASSAG